MANKAKGKAADQAGSAGGDEANDQVTDQVQGDQDGDQIDAADQVDVDDLVQEASGRKDDAAIDLLLYACERLGVNPSKTAKPQELLSWRWISGQGEGPDAVSIVTGGGLKVKLFEDPDWPMDRDTEDRLRRALNLFQVDPKTKDTVALPIPADITLPRQHVDGFPAGAARGAHVYKKGYLKEGGKSEAARRAALRKK